MTCTNGFIALLTNDDDTLGRFEYLPDITIKWTAGDPEPDLKDQAKRMEHMDFFYNGILRSGLFLTRVKGYGTTLLPLRIKGEVRKLNTDLQISQDKEQFYIDTAKNYPREISKKTDITTFQPPCIGAVSNSGDCAAITRSGKETSVVQSSGKGGNGQGKGKSSKGQSAKKSKSGSGSGSGAGGGSGGESPGDHHRKKGPQKRVKFLDSDDEDEEEEGKAKQTKQASAKLSTGNNLTPPRNNLTPPRENLTPPPQAPIEEDGGGEEDDDNDTNGSKADGDDGAVLHGHHQELLKEANCVPPASGGGVPPASVGSVPPAGGGGVPPASLEAVQSQAEEEKSSNETEKATRRTGYRISAEYRASERKIQSEIKEGQVSNLALAKLLVAGFTELFRRTNESAKADTAQDTALERVSTDVSSIHKIMNAASFNFGPTTSEMEDLMRRCNLKWKSIENVALAIENNEIALVDYLSVRVSMANTAKFVVSITKELFSPHFVGRVMYTAPGGKLENNAPMRRMGLEVWKLPCQFGVLMQRLVNTNSFIKSHEKEFYIRKTRGIFNHAMRKMREVEIARYSFTFF